MSNAAYRTITSPGVQITEKDLSLRIENPAGTTIFVPGFAAQGPIGEPILITTASELEAIFGTPTNAAERYFYYSCREILNTTGQLLACRLPYGTDAGSSHSTKQFSALVYPAVLANSKKVLEHRPDEDQDVQDEDIANPQGLKQEWLIGSPLHVTLSQAEYTALQSGNFEYQGTNVDAEMVYAVDEGSGVFATFADYESQGSVGGDLYTFSKQYREIGNTGDEFLELVDGAVPLLFTSDAIEEVKAIANNEQHPLYDKLAAYDASFWNDSAVVFANSAGEATFESVLIDPQTGEEVEYDEDLGQYVASDEDGNQYYLEAEEVEAKITLNAGFFVLNDIQSTINELGEGYYFGIADNFASAADSPDFDSIKSVQTLVVSYDEEMEEEVKTLATIPNERLDVALTATKAESDLGVTSVSETLEKAGFQAYGTTLYQDHLNLAVFRVRRSTIDPTKLTVFAVEKFLGSVDANRKTVNPAGGTPLNAFIETIVNDASPGIKLDINPTITNFNWTNGAFATEPQARVSVAEDAQQLFPLGVYSSNAQESDQSKVIGKIPLKLDKILRSVESTENVEIDVIIDAGLSTIFASTWDSSEDFNGVAKYNDEKTTRVTTHYLQSWQSVALPLITFAESTRKDCVAIIDAPRHIFVQGRNLKTIDDPSKNFTMHIHKPLKKLAPTIESNYGAMYANWVKVDDIFSGKRYWHPMSSFAGATFARSDAASQPWYAPAGLNRGTFNAIDIAFNPNQKQRDNLYDIAVNPVAFFNGDGHTIMGQKTLQVKPSAFDRINVRRLFLTLERAVAKTVKYFVFEPNTQATRARLVNTIAPLFEFAKNNEGVYDYMIVCDDRNNTPQTIDNNELIVDIYLKPVRAAEFILVNFIATRTGQNFSELL